MPFQPGNTYGKRPKPNAGRPPKKEVEIRKAAAEIARDYIDRSVKPVMATYFQLAHGRYVNKYSEGKLYAVEFEADAATTRHFVDKLLPDEQDSPQVPTFNISIGIAEINQSRPELRANGFQISVSSGNGANGNGEHSS